MRERRECSCSCVYKKCIKRALNSSLFLSPLSNHIPPSLLPSPHPFAISSQPFTLTRSQTVSLPLSLLFPPFSTPNPRGALCFSVRSSHCHAYRVQVNGMTIRAITSSLPLSSHLLLLLRLLLRPSLFPQSHSAPLPHLSSPYLYPFLSLPGFNSSMTNRISHISRTICVLSQWTVLTKRRGERVAGGEGGTSSSSDSYRIIYSLRSFTRLASDVSPLFFLVYRLITRTNPLSHHSPSTFFPFIHEKTIVGLRMSSL